MLTEDTAGAGRAQWLDAAGDTGKGFAIKRPLHYDIPQNCNGSTEGHQPARIVNLDLYCGHATRFAGPMHARCAHRTCWEPVVIRSGTERMHDSPSQRRLRRRQYRLRFDYGGAFQPQRLAEGGRCTHMTTGSVNTPGHGLPSTQIFPQTLPLARCSFWPDGVVESWCT